MSQIDVIIPTRNRGDMIRKTLASLQVNTFQDFHVWVVDQSTNEKTAEVVNQFAKRDSRFTLISTKTKGVNIARNIGIASGRAPLIAMTDDDCIVDKNWLASYQKDYLENPHVDSIFGRVIPGVCEESPEKSHKTNRLQTVLPMARKDDLEYQLFEGNRFNLSFGHGANMSYRRKAFTRYGMFDEFLGAGAPLRSWPERDMGYRILANNGTILYSPKATVVHDHWREWDEVKRTYRNYAIGTGAAIGKYIRSKDYGSSYMLIEWIVDQGIRQVASGMLKWRSWQKCYVGMQQIALPWLGIALGLKYDVDPSLRVYQNRTSRIDEKKPLRQFVQ